MENIKNISIRMFLQQRGINPQKNFAYYGMYSSPFRNDHTASFKVDYNKNVWYDFGISEGGSIIDLVMKMNNCSFHEAIKQLDIRTNDCTYQHHNVGTSQCWNADDFSFHRNEIVEINPLRTQN